MNDGYSTSVLGDVYDAVISSVQLIIAPWLLAIAAVFLILRFFSRPSARPIVHLIATASVHGTGVFYLLNLAYYLSKTGWSADAISFGIWIVAFFFYLPTAIALVSVGLYQLASTVMKKDMSDRAVICIILAGIPIQCVWLGYIASRA